MQRREDQHDPSTEVPLGLWESARRFLGAKTPTQHRGPGARPLPRLRGAQGTDQLCPWVTHGQPPHPSTSLHLSLTLPRSCPRF